MTWLAVATMVAAIAGCGGDDSGGNSPGGGSGPPVVATPTLESFAAVVGRRLTADPAGNLYTVTFNNVTKVTASGAIVPLPVVVASPGAVVADAAGNVYVADNKRCVGIGGCTAVPVSIFQKVAVDGTVVPIPIARSSDASDTEIQNVFGLAVDAAGALYFSDWSRGTIRKLTADGDLTAIAGLPLVHGHADGAGSAARFSTPQGVAIDAAGNLFVADGGSHTIRKVTPAGVVTTVAGRPNVAGDADGPALLATFTSPQQVAFDSRGNMYVADEGNALIRKLSPDGIVSTVVGTRGQQGFRVGPAPGVIDRPVGVAVIGNDVYFSQFNTIDGGRIAVLRNAP